MWGGQATHDSQPTLEAQLQSITTNLAPIERHLWALAVLAAVLDIVSTYAGLQVGLSEGNPLAASLIEQVGIISLVGLKAAALAVAGVARCYKPAWGPWLSLGLVVPWLTASGVNAVLLVAV